MKGGVRGEARVRQSRKEDDDDGACRRKGGKDRGLSMREMQPVDARAGGHPIPKCPHCGNDTYGERTREPGNKQ